MSTRTLRLSLLVVLAVVTIAQAAILTRAIEAQKTLVEREEQMLDQAKEHVHRTAQNAYDVSRGAVSNVADQLRYVVTYPWRMANEALEKPKLYAKYMLSKVPSFLGAEEPAPSVALSSENNVEEPTVETNRLPQLVSSFQSFFNGEPTEVDEAPKPSPYIEVIEVKYEGPSVLPAEASDQVDHQINADENPSKDVILK